MTIHNDTPEDAFRLWAFSLYYKAYREDLDMTRRFVRALVESSRPVAPSMIEAWTRAREEIAEFGRALKAGEISRDEWSALIQAAILDHTGVNMKPRAWEGEQAEDQAPAPAPVEEEEEGE